MKQKFLSSSINFIIKHNGEYDTKEEIEKLQYGLEGIYLTLTKTILIIILSILKTNDIKRTFLTF